MLKVYICPSCQAVRFVSKFKIQCFKCNQSMVLSTTPYEDYILLDIIDRGLVIERISLINAKAT